MKKLLVLAGALSMVTFNASNSWQSISNENSQQETLATKKSQRPVETFDIYDDFETEIEKRLYVNSGSQPPDDLDYGQNNNPRYDTTVVNAVNNNSYEKILTIFAIDMFDYNSSVDEFKKNGLQFMIEFDYAFNFWNGSNKWTKKDDKTKPKFQHYVTRFKPSFASKEELTIFNLSDSSHSNKEIVQISIKETTDYNQFRLQLIMKAKVKWTAGSIFNHSALICVANENITFKGFRRGINSYAGENILWMNKDYEVIHNKEYDITENIDKRIIQLIVDTAASKRSNSWGISFAWLLGKIGNDEISFKGALFSKFEDAINKIIYYDYDIDFKIILKIRFSGNGLNLFFYLKTESEKDLMFEYNYKTDLSIEKIHLDLKWNVFSVYSY